MNNHKTREELKQMLEAPFDDHRMSRSEKRAVSEVLKNAGVDDETLSFVRSTN